MERLPGFRDFYPEPVPHQDVWSASARQFIFNTWRAVAHRYGFREYDGPPLEPLELFTIKSGDEIVGQLYNFSDKGDRAVALRPEMTPSLARMVAAHSRNYKKPVKWFAIPQLFRYERQQKGRLREHFQFNADIIGETGAAIDAELISLLIDSLRAFGLTSEDFVIRLSSRSAWERFFNQHSPDPSKAYAFYQIIDKLEREDPAESQNKFAALGFSYEQVQQFIQKGEPDEELQAVLSNLQARGLAPYVKIDYNVVRGLAYYTGIVFEAFDRKGQFRAIAGGGRYDNLVKLISGGKTDMPAIGFGMGDVVLTELLRERKCLPSLQPPLDAFVLIENEAFRQASLHLIQELRDGGFAIEYPLLETKPDKQFKRALELNARYTLRLDLDQAGNSHVLVKDLKTRSEQRVAQQSVSGLLTQKP